MCANEKGRGNYLARPFDLFPYPIAGCPTSVTTNLDGDAFNVSRGRARCKAAIAVLHGDRGDDIQQNPRT